MILDRTFPWFIDHAFERNRPSIGSEAPALREGSDLPVPTHKNIVSGNDLSEVQSSPLVLRSLLMYSLVPLNTGGSSQPEINCR